MKLKALVAALAMTVTCVASGAGITLTQLGTTFPTPIGIDYHQPLNSMVFSINYPTGSPNNFARFDIGTGTFLPFSTISGLTEEVKIATARPGNPGGWAAGTMFTGNGVDGQITRINPDGTLFAGSNWVDLPGLGNGLMRGSLYVDRTGVWGGDLIAVTTAGEVWRINNLGAATMVADVNTHLEGVATVPNDPKYGPLAGKIIAGAEGQGLLYAFGTSGSPQSFDVNVNVEDIDLIDAGENFFGVNFGTSKILAAPASDFASFVGDILLTQEFPTGGSGLYRLHWTGSQLVADLFTVNAGSAPVGQWEHVSFGPVPISVPEPGTGALLGLALFGAFAAARRGRANPKR